MPGLGDGLTVFGRRIGFGPGDPITSRAAQSTLSTPAGPARLADRAGADVVADLGREIRLMAIDFKDDVAARTRMTAITRRAAHAARSSPAPTARRKHSRGVRTGRATPAASTAPAIATVTAIAAVGVTKNFGMARDSETVIDLFPPSISPGQLTGDAQDLSDRALIIRGIKEPQA